VQLTMLKPIILSLSLLAGLSYMLTWSWDIPFVASLIWKGAGVALLALYAGLSARTLDGWLITVVMAVHACSDVALDALGYTAGALLFMVGHAFAIWLYARNRRPRLSVSQTMLVLTVIPLSVGIAFALTQDLGVGIYTVVVATMAALAWASGFSRYRVGIGAMAFLASDLLIFARMGPLVGDQLVGYAIWMLYYFGQVLITLGVMTALDRVQSIGTAAVASSSA
jgi:uncharacterized membrane protein YhhN